MSEDKRTLAEMLADNGRLTDQCREWERAHTAQREEIARLSEPCACCGGCGQMDPGSHAACDPCGGSGRQPKGTNALAKALADVERLKSLLAGVVGLIHLCQHRFPKDLQDEVEVHWRFTEAEAALKETK